MARTTRGTLYTAGKRGHFYLRFTKNGVDTRIRLLAPDGQPVTKRQDAEEAASRIILPLAEKNREQQWRNIEHKIQDAATTARLADAELKNSHAVIANGWNLFMSCPKRPMSCRRVAPDEITRTSTPGNYRGYYHRFKNWLNEHRPDRQILPQITPDDAAAFMEFVRGQSAPGTFNKYLQFFNCFFDVLNKSGKIACGNPFRDVERVENRYNSKKPLSLEQIAMLIEKAHGEMKLLIALGYFTGLRFGDCCTLQWREVDLLRGVIERVPRKTEHTVKDIQQAVVKVGIPPFLRQMLAEIPEDQRQGFVLPEYAREYLSGREYKLNRRLLDHFEACGIQTIRAGTGTPEVRNEKGKLVQKAVRAVVEVGFHSLRYSYISHNAEKGTPAAVIQRNAGHSSPAMTERYTRISDSAAVRYAQVLELPSANKVEPEEPERAQLLEQIKCMPIGEVKLILNFILKKR